MFKQYKNDVRRIIKNCITLTYFMRGSVDYDRLLSMSYAERQEISAFVDDRMELQSKVPYPIL